MDSMCFGKMCFLSVNSLILFQLLDASEHKHGDQECNDEDENECDSWNYEYFISFVAANQLFTPFERWKLASRITVPSKENCNKLYL